MSEIGFLDRFFAKRILKEHANEERELFLAQLMQVSRQGHLCLEKKAPSFPLSVVQEGTCLQQAAPVIHWKGKYYLQKNWVYETYILQHVAKLRSVVYEDLPKQDARLNPSQQRAVNDVFKNAFSIICGGPGTGKTYTASILVKLLYEARKKEKFKVILTAPTGKAASHLQSVLSSFEGDVEAMTLHRLLKITPHENRLFSPKKIDADLIIVDEASMINVSLLAQILESIGSGTRLVLMGDPDQLPPVDAGSLFSEMAHLFGSRLDQPMRTEDAGLLQLAKAINQGDEIQSQYRLSRIFDASMAPFLYQLLKPHMGWQEPDPEICLKEINRFRVLNALRQGPHGVDALNHQIVQEMSRQIKAGQWWAIPIMVTANEPKIHLYNGDCGVLIGKSRGSLFLRDGVAYFPTKVPFHLLPPFEIAFCLSIHKSQGSEFDKVLALFPTGSENFGREAIYTAVTRAKKQVEIVAEEEVLKALLAQKTKKVSGFTDRFIDKNLFVS